MCLFVMYHCIDRAMLVETRILIYATNIKTKFYGHWCHLVLNLLHYRKEILIKHTILYMRQ